MRHFLSISTALATLTLVSACQTVPSDTEAPGGTPDVASEPIESSEEPARLESVVVTGSSADGMDFEPAPSPMVSALSSRRTEDLLIVPKVPLEPEQPPVQSGLLTAGDYDDVLNPDLYKSYLDKALQGPLGKKDLPFVDANKRIMIEAIDRLGKPVPLTHLSLALADGQKAFPLRTGVDGKAYLFPNYDGLTSDMILTASAEGADPMTISLSDEIIESGGSLSLFLDLDRTMPTQLDLLLTLDATGSMSDEMAYLQAELVAIMDRIRAKQPDLDIRAGFIVYRDEGDAYVVRDFDFTDDLDAFKTALGDQAAQGGGDMPEAMHEALQRGLDFEWREDAVKINLLVADAPPHDEHIQATWDTGLISRSRGIHMVSLAASGIDDRAEFMMRGLSQLTNARYLFLTDDSGVGNPHAEPTVDCYVVTRLDQLVERVLVSLVTGQRVEPEGEDVIRTVGNYRNGICAIDADDVS